MSLSEILLACVAVFFAPVVLAGTAYGIVALVRFPTKEKIRQMPNHTGEDYFRHSGD